MFYTIFIYTIKIRIPIFDMRVSNKVQMELQ